jgi:histidyl-tRNA synthetase
MMNYSDFLSTIAATETLSEELRSTAADLLAKHQKQTSAANARARAKKSAENAPLVEAVTNLLRSNAKVFTAAEVKEAIEGIESTSKATAVLKLVEGVKISDVTVDRRVVKGYSL